MEKTTITISKEFKRDLDDMKKNGERLEETLKRKLYGYDKNIMSFEEPICFAIESYDETNAKRKRINVGWTELYDSEVGNVWDLNFDNSKGYDEIAEVIYNNKKECIVKFTTSEYKYKKTINMSNEFILFKFL